MKAGEFPSYYDPKKADVLFQPNTTLATEEGRQLRGKIFSRADDFKNKSAWALIIVDPQIDFCHSKGTLFVPGAVEDIRRIAEYIYRNVNKISTIIVSQDCHSPYQIFFPSWWKDENGNSPKPFTSITYEDFEKGIWRPVFKNLVSNTEKYLKHLQQKSKKTLIIWPYHCLVRQIGSSVMPILEEAICFHSAAKSAQPVTIPKGSIPFSEHYSIWEPEMHVAGYGVQGELNTQMLDQVSKHREVDVCGEADNFCVDESMKSKERYFFKTAPQILKRFRFLEDCTSAVQVPGWQDMVKESRQRMKKLGIRIVKSTDPIN